MFVKMMRSKVGCKQIRPPEGGEVVNKNLADDAVAVDDKYFLVVDSK